MGLLCAEQHVRNFEICTFRNSGIPVCRTRRRKTQKHTLSGILGLLCAEQNVGNINKCTFRNSGTPVRQTKRRKSQKLLFQQLWDSRAQNKTSDISKHALSGILGLLCAEQDVGNLNKGKPFLGSHRNTWGSIGVPGNLEAGEALSGQP